MLDQSQQPRPVFALVLLALAGVLIGAGGLVDWGKLTDTASGQGFTIKGDSLWVALGAGVIVAGAIVYFVANRIVRVVLGAIGAAGGGLLTLGGIVSATDDSVFAKTAAIHFLKTMGGPTNDAAIKQGTDSIVQAIKSGDIKRSVQIGLFLFTAGAALAIVGGVVAIATSRTGLAASTRLAGSPAEPAAAMGSGAEAAWSAPAPQAPSMPEPQTPSMPEPQTPSMPEPPAATDPAAQ